jgi:hypothetical protein
MVLQRRYSVTGPPDHVGQMKPQTPRTAQPHSCDGRPIQPATPQLDALDTNMQTTGCALCEGQGGEAAKSSDTPVEGEGDADRGRKMSHRPVVRTSSKRSATQLPSPSTPSSHELPTKIARLGLEQDDMGLDEGSLTDPFPEESDWALSSTEDSFSTSAPSSPISPPSSVTDEPLIEPLRLTIPDDTALEDLALSPPTALPLLPPVNQTVLNIHVPLTLLTLPPEIRHDIYRHLPDLVLSHPLIYCLSTFTNNMQHPLASVSRLVRSEALAIFYSYNTWIIKLEFKMMYEAFQDWIIRLGDGAASLRLVTIAVRGRLFKPRTSKAPSSIGLDGQMLNQPIVPNQAVGLPPIIVPSAPVEEYCPPDGDASFKVDLSEKFPGGRVELVRCDGTKEAGEEARVYLAEMVARLWEKRRTGTLNGQDWVWMVDDFLAFTGWW